MIRRRRSSANLAVVAGIRRNFMAHNSYIYKTQKIALDALREYPLQILGAGFAFLLLMLAAAAVVIPHHAKAQSLQSQTSVSEAPREIDAHQPLAASASYADVVERASPAVVTVRAEKKVARPAGQMNMDEEMLRRFFGGNAPQMRQQPKVERGLGSGVIVETDGTILTNNHVVEGATTVKVDLPDKRTFDAKVVGTDPASDLAVLKIDAKELPTLALGNSDRVRVGDVVLAIGNPLGLRQTVTSGIISAKGRQTGISDGSFEDFLQTDAAINQGNSGGALINLSGELIGINSQIMSTSGGSIGIGFAIPSNMAKSVMSQLVAGGKVRRGQLGIGIQDVTSALAENFGLKDINGVIVNSVNPGSPAEKAGLKQGDVVRTLNGEAVRDGNEFRNKIAQSQPGTEVELGILRGGEEMSVKASLGEFKAQNDDGDDDSAPAEVQKGKLGLSLQPVTPEIASELKLKDTAGLVVAEVQPGGAADEAGIARGDVILEVNRKPVKSAEEVKAAIDSTKNGQVLLLVSRAGRTIFVTAKVG